MKPPRESISRSESETERFGEQLAADAERGRVFLVEGDLGSGKTTLVRGACRALGVQSPVTSPTYTIGHLYETDDGQVSHLDLYRLESIETEDPGLLDDYFPPGVTVFVEWPPDSLGLDSLPLPDDAKVTRVTVEALPDRSRRLVVE